MEEKTGNKVVFTPPKGFMPPESKGDEFDLVCTFRKEEGGKLCLVKLGDTDMGGYEGDHNESKETQSKPDYSRYSQGMMGGMGGDQSGAALG